MKKQVYIISFLLSLLLLVGCSNKNKLYFLNWGEYVNPELITIFEKKYNVDVVMQEVSSSEEMYNEVIARKTRFDVICVGDYILERMINEDLLQKLDYNIITNYYDGIYVDSLEKIIKTSNTPYLEYGSPYFWGVYVMMYNNEKKGLKPVIEEEGLNIFFDHNSHHGMNINVGMYDVERYVTTAYLLNQNLDVNTTDIKLLEPIVDAIKDVGYKSWGTDDLKKDVVKGSLDVIFTQIGDFFDTTNIYITDHLNSEGKLNSDFKLKADLYIPSQNVAFFDSLAIPKNARNPQLANEFINFFMDNDVEFAQNNYHISLMNAEYVGYSPTLKPTVELLKQSTNVATQFFNANYPEYLDPAKNVTSLSILKNLDSKFISEIITLISKTKS